MKKSLKMDFGRSNSRRQNEFQRFQKEVRLKLSCINILYDFRTEAI